MNRSIIRHLIIAALVAYPLSALGQDQAPDVKGKWIGKTHTILVGKGGHWPKGRRTWDQPALLEKDLAFDIRGQDGRRFWGVTTISGGGEKTDEPFIGELTGKDYKSFVFADTDGFWNGQLRRRRALVLLHAYPQQVHRGQLLAGQASALTRDTCLYEAALGAMSALCPKRAPAPRQKILLFDHLVGAGEYRSRYGYAQQLRGCEIDEKFKLRRLLDRQFTRFRATKNLVGVLGCAPEHVQKTWTIRYQASGFDVLTYIEKRWQSRRARRFYYAVQVEIHEWVANDVHGLRIPLERLEGERDVLCSPNFRRGDINPKRAGQFLKRTALQQGICIAGIGNDG